MDDLVYQYNLDALGRLSNNQLRYVDDAVTTAGINSDIEDQANGNYTYDGSGRLKKDIKENIGNIGNDGITWTNTNKVKSIRRQGSGSEANIDYYYNNMGQRVKKVVKGRNAGAALGQDQWEYTYYVYDAAGNIMAIYDRNYNGLIGGNYADILTVSEQNIYGSSRLGQVKSNRSTTSNFTASYSATDETGALYFTNLNYTTIGATGDGHTYTNNAQNYSRQLGVKNYELTNHLNSVCSVIQDRKKSVDSDANGISDYYLPSIISYSDYYSFGSIKPGRNFQEGESRLGFAGKEKEKALSEGAMDFGERFVDNRIARWFSMDFYHSKYPSHSPYIYGKNNPITIIDPDGNDDYYFDEHGRLIHVEVTNKTHRYFQEEEVILSTEWVVINTINPETGDPIYGLKTATISTYHWVETPPENHIYSIYQYHKENGTVMDFANSLPIGEFSYQFAQIVGQDIVAMGHEEFIKNGGWIILSIPFLVGGGLVLETAYEILLTAVETGVITAEVFEELVTETICETIAEETGVPVDLIPSLKDINLLDVDPRELVEKVKK
jgi:RHS repeat-associated protein